MNNRFAGPNMGFRRRSERERLFFFAAAGLAFSLLIITLVVFQFRSDVEAVQNKASPSAMPQKLSTVVVYGVERQVGEGTKLSDVKLKELYWKYDQVPEGALRDLSEIKNMYAAETLRPEIPLVRAMLSSQPVQKSLPVARGYRAKTIPVDAITGFEGLLKPGSRVDLTLTYYEQGELTTKAIVQNVRVLSYGGVTNPSPLGPITAPAKVAATATLEVTPEDGMKITTAQKLGTLSLMLRGDDSSPIENDRLDENDITGSKKPNQNQGSICGKAKGPDGIEVLIPCSAGEQPYRIDKSDLP